MVTLMQDPAQISNDGIEAFLAKHKIDAGSIGPVPVSRYYIHTPDSPSMLLCIRDTCEEQLQNRLCSWL